MLFTFICLFTISLVGWVGWVCYLVWSKSEAHPMNYLLVLCLLPWCVTILPAAFKVSFGG